MVDRNDPHDLSRFVKAQRSVLAESGHTGCGTSFRSSTGWIRLDVPAVRHQEHYRGQGLLSGPIPGSKRSPVTTTYLVAETLTRAQASVAVPVGVPPRVGAKVIFPSTERPTCRTRVMAAGGTAT